MGNGIQTIQLVHDSTRQKEFAISYLFNETPNFPSSQMIFRRSSAIFVLLNTQKKSSETSSMIIGDSAGIKLTHHLFVVSLFKFSSPSHRSHWSLEKKKDLDDDSDITNSSDISIEDWPVPSSNQAYLDEINNSHDVQQIPAYDIRGDPIHPLQYEEKLAGAIVRVCFTIVHYLIKQKHIYNALPHDITIL